MHTLPYISILCILHKLKVYIWERFFLDKSLSELYLEKYFDISRKS